MIPIYTVEINIDFQLVNSNTESNSTLIVSIPEDNIESDKPDMSQAMKLLELLVNEEYKMNKLIRLHKIRSVKGVCRSGLMINLS